MLEIKITISVSDGDIYSRNWDDNKTREAVLQLPEDVVDKIEFGGIAQSLTLIVVKEYLKSMGEQNEET